MPASTILYIFVFFIVLVILIEYINDKKYQAKKDKKSRKTTPKKPTEPIKESIEEESIPQVEPEPQVEKAPEEDVQIQPSPIEKIKPEEIIEEVKEAKELPECKYPPFTHVRLVEMGLSDAEAIEFVHELIPQLEEQIPLIENAINSADFHQIEKLTHGIKGSATNIGTGGVADLLSEFNTYLKSEIDADIVKAYHAHFIHYIEDLKKQYT